MNRTAMNGNGVCLHGSVPAEKIAKLARVRAFCGDVMEAYGEWDRPELIFSDGPYGIGGYKGDLESAEGLAEWYEPHVEAWSRACGPDATLWFWNTENGWAAVHPVLQKAGWDYEACCIWDKGMGHAAGNVNTKTIRHLPIVTEVCVQYSKRAVFDVEGREATMQEWLRHEWLRAGLSLSEANAACGTAAAATRKYLTQDGLWYMPPPDAFALLADYAAKHGRPEGRPYFSLDGIAPLTAKEWTAMRPVFRCPMGRTNVWHVPQLMGRERLKIGGKAVHLNQKPLSIVRDILEMSSREGGTVWDPFAGLFTVAVAASELKRRCFCAEINAETFASGMRRLLGRKGGAAASAGAAQDG